MGSVTSKRRDRITQEEKYANKENRRQQVFQSPSLNISSPMDSNTDIESQVEDTVISENERKELLSLFTDKNISMDFVLEMKEAFIYFDKDGDGFISAKELGSMMRTMGRNPTEEELMDIMNEIDVDHNGKLDFSEFTMMMREKLTVENVEEEILLAFRAFDRNGDGYICKTEFKHCMMQFGDKFSDEEVEELMKEADINNDGKIDYEEFSKMIMNEIS